MEKKEKIEFLVEKTNELSSNRDGITASAMCELLDSYEELVSLLREELAECEKQVKVEKLRHAIVCKSIQGYCTGTLFGTNTNVAYATLSLIRDYVWNEMNIAEKESAIHELYANFAELNK